MEVLCITATKNRHTHLEKLVRCFLEQDYDGLHTLLIFNNSTETLKMGSFLRRPEQRIILINAPKDLDGKPFTNLGAIYNDILKWVNHLISENRVNPFLVNHMDDDDFFLPNHISEGVKGYKKGGVKAYKPAKSYYKSAEGITTAENVLEPSIFVEYDFLKKEGYWDRNVDLHHKWLQPLIDGKNIFIDKEGKPTFVYDWGGQIPTWKTSGDPNNPENFQNYAHFSVDIGDGIVVPASKNVFNDFKV